MRLELFALAALAMLASMPALAFADVLPSDARYVPTCTIISNIGDYPDMQLILETFSGLDTNDTPDTRTKLFLFSGDACVSGYLPPGRLTKLHYASKQYLDSVGGLSGLKLGPASYPLNSGQLLIYRTGINDSNVHGLGGFIILHNKASIRGWQDIDSFVEQWRLEGNDGNLHLTGFKMIGMKNGAPALPSPKPPEKNPFEAFWCWLIGMFGGKC